MGIFSFVQSLFGPTEGQKSANDALATKQAGLQTAQNYYQPYAQQGNDALGKFRDAIGMGNSGQAMTDFQNSPNVKLNMNWAQQQGADAVNNHAMASGMYDSGATLKALQDRAAQTNNTFYSNYVQNLAGQAGMGANVAGHQANLEYNGTNGISDAQINQGNANQAASWGNGLDGAADQVAKLVGIAMGTGGGGGSMFGGGTNPIASFGQTMAERNGTATSLY